MDATPDSLKATNAATSAHLAFRFEKKFDCAKLPPDQGSYKPRGFCREENPKDWTSEERAIIEKAIGGAMTHSKLRKPLLDLAKRQPIAFFRVETSVSLDADHRKQKSDDSIAFFDNVKGGIVIQDFLFEDLRKKMAACPNVPNEFFTAELEHVIVHELGHLYSESKGLLDVDCGFLAAAGWSRRGHKLFSETARIGLESKTRTMKDQDAAKELLKQKAAKLGYPTYYGLTDPREAFAEFFAFLGRESSEAKAVKPAVATWFDKNVFEKQTMGKGRPCPK